MNLIFFKKKLKAKQAHNDLGTFYGDGSQNGWEYGPECAHFIVPYMMKKLKGGESKILLDSGCGFGFLSFKASLLDWKVFGIDLQENMIDKAEGLLEKFEHPNKPQFSLGNSSHLFFPDHFFDFNISIFLTSNIPLNHIDSFFSVLHSTLKPDGEVIISSQMNQDIVFTSGRRSQKEVIEHLEAEAFKMESCYDLELLNERLNPIDDVITATFVERDNKLHLLHDERELKFGEPIWRKTPKCVIPNYYYDYNFHLKKFKEYGFEIIESKPFKFSSEKEWEEYNKNAKPEDTLSKNFYYNPFCVFYHLRKK